MPSEQRRGRRPSGWLPLATAGTLLFLHVPVWVVMLYAFSSEERSFSFPPAGFTLHWFRVAWERADLWQAVALSARVATVATGLALLLGTLAAIAIWRSRFFGREAVSFLLLLPIALPGIVTGIALRSSIGFAGMPFGFWTIVVGHATFCVVVVYNNALARLRRLQPTLLEASMDLGADAFQTFRFVLLPQLRSALLAGAMLAFALSFDEVIVTTFTAGQQQTLPIWIFSQLTRPRDRPVTNVVAIFVVALTFVPILLAHRLTRESGIRSVAVKGRRERKG